MKGKAPKTTQAKRLPQHTSKRVRFPGIMRDAQRLKVSRIHLYLVLTGQRVSHRLLARYQALNKSAA